MTLSWKTYGVWLAGAVVILVLPLVFPSGFALSLLGQMGVAVIFALAFNMLLGQGGMLSFGHAIYFGLAGYFTIHFLNLLGDEAIPYFPVSLLPLLGGVVSLFFGILIGFVSTRRAGTTFAMISLGFGEMVTALTLILVAFFNGEEGIQGDRWVGPEPFGITYGSGFQVYYLIGVWCMVSIVAMYFLTKTPFGRMSNAVRDNPERVQFIGYNTQRVRWLAFSLSSFFSGIAGALHAINFEHVGFETVSLAQSGLVLFMVYIGGAGSFAGPIVGAVLITYLTGNLGDLSEAWYLYLGIFFIIVVMYSPGGLVGLITIHTPVWRVDASLLRKLAAPYAAAVGSSVVACVGLIGLVELIYFLSHNLVGESELGLYGLTVHPFTVGPWLVLLAISVAGVWLCRRTYPGVATAFNTAMAEARARMAA